MKTLVILSVILDILIIAGFLFFPRTGMEAMGSAFILLPLMAIRIIVALVGLFMAWRRKRWGVFIYTLVMLAVLGGLSKFGWSLKPTDKPLYKALRWKAREQAGKISDYRDQKAYDARRMIQKAGDADHARLCDLLAEKRDLAGLEGQLALELDLSKTCVTFDGDRVGPVMHAVIHSYGPWPDGPRKRPPVDTENLPAAVKQLLDHGADPNARDRRGNTPLHYALIHQEEALADVLLAGGACVFLRNDQEESPARMRSTSSIQKKVRAAAKDPAMVARCPDLHRPMEQRAADAPARDSRPQLSPDAGLLNPDIS